MTNLASILTQIYHDIPDQSAITMIARDKGDQSLSYRQLYLGAVSFAHALTDANINPGEIVIIIQPHSEMLIYSFWGCILHGAIPSIMPFLTEKLSPEHYRKSLESLFKITQPASLITYREFANAILRDTEIGDSVRKVIISEEIELNSDYASYFPSGLDRQPYDIAFLQHSSGTTGLQKGVALSHEFCDQSA